MDLSGLGGMYYIPDLTREGLLCCSPSERVAFLLEFVVEPPQIFGYLEELVRGVLKGVLIDLSRSSIVRARVAQPREMRYTERGTESAAAADRFFRAAFLVCIMVSQPGPAQTGWSESRRNLGLQTVTWRSMAARNCSIESFAPKASM